MIARAGIGDRRHALALCDALPAHPTQVAAWIHEGGLDGAGQTRGALFLEDGGGLAFVSELGVIMPHLDRADSLDELARTVGPIGSRVVVGPTWSAGEYWERLARRGCRARIRREQVGYAVPRAAFCPPGPSVPNIDLRPAEPRDLDALVEASAAMALEESRDDPRSRNPTLFRARIADRIGKQRDFVLFEGPKLVFKVNVAAVSPFGGHIEGVYTAPSHRRRGLGKAGIAWVTAWILERGAVATLLVNRDNAEARRLYEDLGFAFTHESCTILAR
jgi:GNAT superfamily N-acetyltransferase